jgi:hypothetical protein
MLNRLNDAFKSKYKNNILIINLIIFYKINIKSILRAKMIHFTQH